MSITEVHSRPDIPADSKLYRMYEQFTRLMQEIDKALPEDTVRNINLHVATVNASILNGDALRKLIKQVQITILKQLEKEHKIVARKHYRNTWMLLGFTLFGLPIGSAFGTAMGNIGLLGVGLPIGMAIGAAIGTSMDKKAYTEGRQLNIEISY